jgi:predicted MPP superfamily phosphohydrolase
MMLRILVLLLLLIIVPPVYLDLTYVRRTGKRWLRVLLYAPNFVMLVGAIMLTVFETYTPANAYLTNIYLTLFLGFIVTETIAALFLFLAYFWKSKPHTRRLFYILAIVASAANVYTIIMGITYGKYHIVEKQTVIEVKDLPDSFDGYRIVQLSDFHIGTYRRNPRFVNKVVKAVNRQHADMIALTGDMVNYNAKEILPFLSILKGMKAKDGVYSVMGNHDYMPYIHWKTTRDRVANIKLLQDSERSLGWTLLLNDNRIITRGQDSLAIVGVENDGRPPFPQLGNLKKAQRGLPETVKGRPLCKILLSHDPSHWRRRVLPETNIQLMLAGHTHGGQLKLFGFVPVSLLMHEWGGLYSEGDRQLYVSTGLGEALLTFRFGIWPQIDIITLKKKAR